MSFRHGDTRWRVAPGDMLWIRADETFGYEADDQCVAFYSTSPLHMSGSVKRTNALPRDEPTTVG